MIRHNTISPAPICITWLYPCTKNMTRLSDVQSVLDQMGEVSEVYSIPYLEKQKKLEKMSSQVCKLVGELVDEEKSDDTSRSKKPKTEGIDRAMRLYWEGKALSYVDDKAKEAETLVSKAVKLNPRLVEGWNCLGHIYWQQKDLRQAQNCFEGALKHGDSKDSLRSLSVVLRNIIPEEGKAQAERTEALEKSIRLARQAVMCDMQDTKSWYLLGNAYLTAFFAGGRGSDYLGSALKAYHKADPEPVASPSTNPDLYFNRGNVYKFQENYSLAIADYRRARTLDPTLPDMVEDLIRLCKKLSALVQSNAGIKSKRMKTLLTGIPTSVNENLYPSSSWKYGSVKDLSFDVNKGVYTSCRVVAPVTRSEDIPVSFLVVCASGRFCEISLYNVTVQVLSGIRVGDTLLVFEPLLKEVSIVDDRPNGDSKEYSYTCLQVDEPSNVLVNGQRLGRDFLASPNISIMTQ